MKPHASLLLLPLLLASCSTPAAPPAPPAAAGNVKYRYENTLDLNHDNTLNHVLVVGYDEANVLEATRLDVSAGGPVLSLHSVNSGNALYNPKVELTKKGTLLVSWGEIDDGFCKVELAADAAGNLKIVSRKEGAY